MRGGVSGTLQDCISLALWQSRADDGFDETVGASWWLISRAPTLACALLCDGNFP